MSLKNRLFYLSIVVLLCCSFAPGLYGALKAKKVKVIFGGEIIKKKVSLYGFKSGNYFALRELAKLYDGRLVWHPITGKVTLLMNNRKMDFFVKSTKVVIGKKTIRLEQPSHIIDGKLYVLSDFVLSDDYSEFTNTASFFNPETNILTIEKTVNVTSPRFYSEPGSTRVVIEMLEKISYYADQKKSGRILLSFPRGRVSKELIEVGDGVIKDIDSRQKGRQALVGIYFAKGAGKVKKKLLSNPRRLEISIERTDLAGELPERIITPEIKPVQVSSPVPASASVPASTAVQPEKLVSKVSSAPAVIAKTHIKRPVKKKIIVVLDAGHGDKDSGAVGRNGTKEKDINLKIVKELKRLFENDPDKAYEVVLTRDDDTFIPLVERTNIANEKRADLFISVHCNASLKKASNGFEIYFLSENATDAAAEATAILENSVIKLEGKATGKRAKLQELLWSLVINEFINESSELCCFISKEVTCRTKIKNRGVKQAGFHVLRGAQMPAVLVESAFLSNLTEESKLRTKRFQRKIADSVYEGIKKYERRKKVLNAKR